MEGKIKMWNPLCHQKEKSQQWILKNLHKISKANEDETSYLEKEVK